MTTRTALLISVDGLRASALGAYGNTWQSTPALNRLASQSLILDSLYAHGPRIEDFFWPAWTGVVDGPVADECLERRSLFKELKTQGVESTLITDDPRVACWGEAAGFSSVVLCEWEASQSATDAPSTGLARFFAIASQQIQDSYLLAGGAQQNRVFWIHTRGLRSAWDAPHELRQLLLDEDDPPAPTFVPPPTALRVEDQDELLLVRAAYMAQIAVLDQCIGALLESLEELVSHSSALTAIVGCRGLALGEHGHVGADIHSLYSELLHVPCLLRCPGSQQTPRSAHLVQPRDMNYTLASWFGLASFQSGMTANRDVDLLTLAMPSLARQRESLVATGDSGERCVITGQWMLRLESSPSAESGSEPKKELFVKPDDRWEANDVADRCPDIVEELSALLAPSQAAPAG